MRSPRFPVPRLAPNGPPASPGVVGRSAGNLFLLTVLLTVVSVAARVSAQADRPDLVESLAAIAASKGLYGVGGATRCIAGISLLAGAYLLGKRWSMRERPEAVRFGVLFGLSGVCTALSGACAFALAVSLPDAMDPTGSIRIDLAMTSLAAFRRFGGMLGFALAGWALVVAARLKWKAGGSLRWVAPGSAILGVAMQFIWINAATLMHQVAGISFLVWLAVAGGLLRSGWVARQFAR